MNSLKHKEAAAILGCSRNHINYLIRQGYLERVGYGAVTAASVNEFLSFKDVVPRKVSNKKLNTVEFNLKELWTEITELKHKVKLLEDLFDAGVDELEIDELRAKALYNTAKAFDSKTMSIPDLKDWASVCIRMSLSNLVYICEHTEPRAWYYFYKSCDAGSFEARYRANANLLLEFRRASKNIKELSLLVRGLQEGG